MQFQYNADYPGLSAIGSTGAPAQASNPLPFPPAQPMPCARITTRVFHPSRNQVATVQNVLVPTAPLLIPGSHNANINTNSHDDDSFSSGMSSSASSATSDDSMNLEDDSLPSQSHAPQSDITFSHTHHPIQNQTSANTNTNTNTNIHAHAHAHAHTNTHTDGVQNAYWIQRTIREAIYGRVLFAVVLKKRHATIDGAEWEVTSEHCAVKEMAWAHIRKERDRLAEDPIKEVSAMQYIQKWFQHTKLRTNTDAHIHPTTNYVAMEAGGAGTSSATTAGAAVAESFRAMRESNIMMPLDLLTDERNLYSIMPYCDGGELFERLDLNERFSEEEARYWMDQILNVSTWRFFLSW